MKTKFLFKKYFFFIFLVLLFVKFFSYVFNFKVLIFFFWFFLVFWPSIFVNIFYKIRLTNFIKLKFPYLYKKNGNNFITLDFIHESQIKENINAQKLVSMQKQSLRFIGYSFIVLIIFIVIDNVI